MPRKPTAKILTNTRLLKDYASWIYCEGCGKTVAYLCYVAYDRFDFEYKCNCQNVGCVHIEFENEHPIAMSAEPFTAIKNRLCCPDDNSPLVTVIDKNLQEYKLSVVCNKCNTEYHLIKP